MNNSRSTKDSPSSAFAPVPAEQIEKANLRRVVVICACTLAFEVINLFNPNFWSTPILWIGAAYLSAVSIGFLIALFLKRKSAFRNPGTLHALFWALFSIGFFPFLVRDASRGDSPLNCVLLCTLLICAPLLRVQNLRIVFSISTAVNLIAAWYAMGFAVPFQYTLELLVINLVSYLAARNLHGRYFELLDAQQRLYDQQLAEKLEQETLRSKLDQDRRVNADRSEFLARMSHDLRTPLNAVIGLSDMAMDQTLSRGEINDCLSDINSAAKHLLSLINDALDMSKLENRKMTLHPELYSVRDFLGTIRSVIGTQCERRHIHFLVVPDEGFPECLVADKLRFNQVFLNLLSNALKFTPEGGEISLRLYHEDIEDGKIRLTAVTRDNGRGMDPAFAARAFDAFSQETAEDGERGAGLGLTIVKSIVELMSGSIQIESQKGVGTNVTVTIPIATAKLSETPPADTKEPGAEFLRGKRILLCEDHPLNQKVAAYLLETKEAIVETAENGKIGVELFAKNPPFYYDAILMDIRMPVMNGLEATGAIRAFSRKDAKAIPIIAMTANAYEEDAEKSRDAGMNAHLCKPIDPASLYQTLATYLSKE